MPQRRPSPGRSELGSSARRLRRQARAWTAVRPLVPPAARPDPPDQAEEADACVGELEEGTEATERAANSVAVLLSHYAKYLDRRQAAANHRTAEPLSENTDQGDGPDAGP